MTNSKNLWNLTNRPSTKTKLEILKKVFDMWLTVWNKQDWVTNEWYVMDLFAGKGKYDSGESGSPLIFLETIYAKKDKLRDDLKIKLFLVEANKENFKELKNTIEGFVTTNKILNHVEIVYYNADANIAISEIMSGIHNSNKHPLFVLIDPTGLQFKKENLNKIINLRNPKDFLYNYILEGVRRTGGLVKKAHRGRMLNSKEIKATETLKKFIGEDINILDKDDVKIMEAYCQAFTGSSLKVVAYDVSYPDRDDTLYYLLFASRKPSITKIVKDIYARQKVKQFGPTLFGGKKIYEENILSFSGSLNKITRKTLLYKTKVEYGDWTINHIVGCMHGCTFPCYAMMMAKKFGWVKDDEDWRRPRIVGNAMDLLEMEIPKYKDQIDFVHLCFMTDPFMYDHEKKDIIPDIKELTLKIITRLNKDGIKVTTLTKGLYPDELLDKERFSKSNEYGITIVSLNDNFKQIYEPYSSPYEHRIESLKKLEEAGLNTWVSIEPYPTPELDPTAVNIENILEKISFVKKIIFGKLNYNRLVNYSGTPNYNWKNSQDFYEQTARKVIDFCKKNNIQYHIKAGTPLSNENGNIFKKQ